MSSQDNSTPHHLDQAALERAADRLDKIGRHYNWWPTTASWRSLDPVNKDEFLAAVEQIITAYQDAAP